MLVSFFFTHFRNNYRYHRLICLTRSCPSQQSVPRPFKTHVDRYTFNSNPKCQVIISSIDTHLRVGFIKTGGHHTRITVANVQGKIIRPLTFVRVVEKQVQTFNIAHVHISFRVLYVTAWACNYYRYLECILVFLTMFSYKVLTLCYCVYNFV